MSKTTTDDLINRRKRLRIRAWRRGTKEMDLILGRYVDEYLSGMDMQDMDRLEHVMIQDDLALYRWISGVEDAPDELQEDLGPILQFIEDNPL